MRIPFKLIEDWKEVCLYSFSMWFMVLGFLCLHASDVIYKLTDIDTDPSFWSYAGTALFVLGALGRITEQRVGVGHPDWDRGETASAPNKRFFRFMACLMAALVISLLTITYEANVADGRKEVRFLPASTHVMLAQASDPCDGAMCWWKSLGNYFGDKGKAEPDPVAKTVTPTRSSGVPYTDAAFLKVATPFLHSWEGRRNHAYLDTIASPHVWTICEGWTIGVKKGDYLSDAECDALIGPELLNFRAELHKFFTVETKTRRLTLHRDTAYTSLAWNAGARTIGKSTAVRRLNAGNIAGGCDALGWWNKAGGRVVRGLVNRRTAEIRYCKRGLVA